MPLYEYECESCGKRTETLQRLDDPPLAECPHCGGRMRKLFSAPAFHLKGSGWYISDYARKGAGKGADTGKQGEKGAAGEPTATPAGAGKPAESASADKPASSSPAASKKNASE